MSTLLEKFNKSQYVDVINKGADKTPLSLDGGKNMGTDANLEKVRGNVQTKKYSDSITGNI